MCLPCIDPSNFIADEPRRAEEQALRERRRLTGQEPAPYESLLAYKDALKMCQAAVERNVRARAESGPRRSDAPSTLAIQGEASP